MCGINGTFLFKKSTFTLTPSYINTMRDTMVHRGPDGAGTWISADKRIGMGHRRLAIIDPSPKASQPMVNSDSSLCLSFNGEIYNHAEIRQEIHTLTTSEWLTDHSDTEVVLKAFELWGIECVHKFRGMFAIAIWDGKTRTLWLIRDRIGVKPLYYSVHNQQLSFASEIKALVADPRQERAVNEEGLYHYLSFLTTPAPNTLFKGIKKIPGGTFIKIHEDGTLYEHRYWDVWDHVTPMHEASDEQVAQEVINELRTAVHYRTVSDVPIGVFLSGGVDSSTNAALFAASSSKPIKTFSIGYEGTYQSYQNELHFARRMANTIHAQHYEKRLTLDDLLSFIPRMVYLQDEPIADPVCIPVHYVSKLAKDNGVTVCQLGEGADELFWGYPSWKTALTVEHLNRIPYMTSLKKLGLLAAQCMGKGHSRAYELLRRGSLGQPVFWGGAEAFTEREKYHLLSPRLQGTFKNTTSWEALKPLYDRYQAGTWEDKPLQWMSYLDLNLRLPELLLMRVDKMSMGVSLEGRVPFLDHKFVELAMSIPQSMKTRHGTLKTMLKNAVRGLIPDSIIERNKQGFGVPIYEWCFDRLGQEMRTTLETFCQESDLLNFQAIQHHLQRGDGPRVWYLYNLALWWNTFIKPTTIQTRTLL